MTENTTNSPLALLEAAEAELIQQTFDDIKSVRDSLHVEDFAPEGADASFDVDMGEEWCDVRLNVQVADDAESYVYSVLSGDSSFDQDHRGFWGSGCIRPDSDDVQLTETARELVDQVLEHVAQA